MLEEILRQLFVNAFTKLYGQEPPVGGCGSVQRGIRKKGQGNLRKRIGL